MNINKNQSKTEGMPEFHKNGLFVSEADYAFYTRMNFECEIGNLYRGWLDEHNSDGVRRLCLRCLLWRGSVCRIAYDEDSQPIFSATYGVHPTYAPFITGFYRLEKSLKENLAWRPKLARELYEELLFIVESRHEYIRSEYVDKNSNEFATMIEFLIPYLSPEFGAILWPHARRLRPEYRNPANMLVLCLKEKGFPKYLTEQILKEVEEVALAEINTGQWDSGHSLQDNHAASRNTLLMIANFIRDHTEALSQDGELLERLLTILEQLPAGVSYLSQLYDRRWNDLCIIIKSISSNENLCCRLVLRALLHDGGASFKEEMLRYKDINIIFWALGFTHRNQKLLSKSSYDDLCALLINIASELRQ